MKLTVAGAGYVGLVTAVCLAEVGHDVMCYDVDHEKINMLKLGISPIYEPDIEEMLKKNSNIGRLTFTQMPEQAYQNRDVIFLAVPTPQQHDGSADLTFIMDALHEIGDSLQNDCILVTKSTVPVGTNDKIRDILVPLGDQKGFKVDVVSNPEFLREGSAVYDMFHGDRIVIGSDSAEATAVMEELYRPFNIPLLKTDIKSAEMIKYASNAFLATKISFINEIANICSKVGADIEVVSKGMGMDERIGDKFLQAGIGYGGSCFPKDTRALVQIAGDFSHAFELLESVIKVNNKQQISLLEKAKARFGSLKGLKVALLGLAFKPNTDDIREAASIVLANALTFEGAEVTAYDPVAMDNTKKLLGSRIDYANSAEEALENKDAVFIVTEWAEFKQLPPQKYVELMSTPVIFDGRNCYNKTEMEQYPLEYHSIGRQTVDNLSEVR